MTAAPPPCPDSSPLPWSQNPRLLREVLDANGAWVAMAMDEHGSAFIAAAANATQEKEKPHEQP